MFQVNREIVFQPFESYSVNVLTTPTQLNDSVKLTKMDLIDSFVLSVDSGAANNIFIGGPSVTVTNGIEIVRGAGPVLFLIKNQEQQYELQEPAVAIAETLQCTPNIPRALPFIVWDFSQLYVIAIANTNARIAPFRRMFI